MTTPIAAITPDITASIDQSTGREWVNGALDQRQREAARSADTHLLHVELPAYPGIAFYFKDESAHPSGSLKHRLARSLFLYALFNGRLREGQAVVDAVQLQAQGEGIKAKAVIARSDLVAESIISAVKKNKCDLVVMASHGRKGIKRVLLGSETQHVLTHSSVPVLVLR